MLCEFKMSVILWCTFLFTMCKWQLCFQIILSLHSTLKGTCTREVTSWDLHMIFFFYTHESITVIGNPQQSSQFLMDKNFMFKKQFYSDIYHNWEQRGLTFKWTLPIWTFPNGTHKGLLRFGKKNKIKSATLHFELKENSMKSLCESTLVLFKSFRPQLILKCRKETLYLVLACSVLVKTSDGLFVLRTTFELLVVNVLLIPNVKSCNLLIVFGDMLLWF